MQTFTSVDLYDKLLKTYIHYLNNERIYHEL